MVRRYGSEHCQELRIVQRDGADVVAGILIHPLKNKKVAQTAFGINFKSWKINRTKYTRDWYRELSLDEYFSEFANEPRVLGRRMQALVSSTVMRLLQIGAAAARARAEAKETGEGEPVEEPPAKRARLEPENLYVMAMSTV